MSKIILKYTGGIMNGAITGVPAKDLTAAELERLNKEGVTTESLIQSGLYEEVVPQKAQKITPKIEAGNSGEE